MPAYSNVLGMMSACAGRALTPDDVGRVGFEFHCESQDVELERKDRWELKSERLQPIAKKKVPRVLRAHSRNRFDEVPQGVGWRQVYWRPALDLYLTETALRNALDRPAATPRFGRSQDIAWIRSVSEVDLDSRPKGALGPTLIPYPQRGVAGLVVRLPEWFENSIAGESRRAGPFGHYQAMLPTVGRLRFGIERADLFHPSDAEKEEDVIYLHRWLTS
jgi:hypothetical protein